MDTTKTIRRIELKFQRPNDLDLYFTNNIQVSAGATGEVQIFFGRIKSAVLGDTPDSVTVEQNVGVVMTLFEYKRMLKVFQRHLPKLEAVAAAQQASKEEESESDED